MIGAIIGDVAGSYYEVLEMRAMQEREDKKRSYEERIKILDKNVPLLTENSMYTDDTALTVALMRALLTKKDYSFYLRSFGEKEINLGLDKYGRNRFGRGFIEWINGNGEGKSIGNGASMRVSPIGVYFRSLDKVIEESTNSAKPSHNSTEAIKYANAVACSIFLAKHNYSKDYIKDYLKSKFDITLDFDLEILQKENRFSALSSKSVPEALYIFMISNDFEDGIRKALSIGGDADTIASIVGALCEAYYGIPTYLKEEVRKFISDNYLKIIDEFYGELTLIEALEDIGIYDEKAFEFLRGKAVKLPLKMEEFGYGCFPKCDKDGILRDIRLCVPLITGEKELLVNIHEYAHAFELYQQLNCPYQIDVEQSEKNAREKEKLYLSYRKDKKDGRSKKIS